MAYDVKDISLAAQGERQIELAEGQMQGLMKVRARFRKEQPLAGLRIGLCLHVSKETGALVRTLADGGARVAVAGCNPLSTQDDVAASLAQEGFDVFAQKGQNKDEYFRNINRVLDTKPHITMDDGCDLVTEVHTKRKELLAGIIGGTEETTTGVIRLRAMEQEGALTYPVIAVNDSKTKMLMDNYYGTGQSTIDGILRATNVLLAGKTFVVCGYGNCGKGVALRARGMGAHVIVTEVNPFRALQAHYDGFGVMPIEEAARLGDIFVTATGNKHVIRMEHVTTMNDGAILANTGHFNVEIDVEALEREGTKRKIRDFMDEYSLHGKRVYVLSEGRLVNITAAEGHPSEIMSMSFMNQALAVEYLVKNKEKLGAKVHVLPQELDDAVARLQLEALGITVNSLTEAQKKYLSEWREGT